VKLYKHYYFILIILIFISCMNNPPFIPKENQAIIADSDYSKDPDDYWMPDERQTDKALDAVFKYLNNSKKDNEVSNILKNKDKYCVQFIGIIRNKNKIIFCNFLPKNNNGKNESWKKYYILTKDGGFWFWNIEYDLNKNKCQNFVINKDA
jgi:hypothetical protein